MLYYSSQHSIWSTPIQILSILINIVLAHSWRYSNILAMSDDSSSDVYETAESIRRLFKNSDGG